MLAGRRRARYRGGRGRGRRDRLRPGDERGRGRRPVQDGRMRRADDDGVARTDGGRVAVADAQQVGPRDREAARSAQDQAEGVRDHGAVRVEHVHRTHGTGHAPGRVQVTAAVHVARRALLLAQVKRTGTVSFVSCFYFITAVRIYRYV